MKQALAVRYYTDKKLSLGQCAELAEMNEKAFINHLSMYGVSIFVNESAKRYFKTALHKGEVEVMILADELNADNGK